MLRIWDCFLMEGPKVLFRFTIALLGLYEEDILAHTDTISVIKVLKAGVRLALDVDGLVSRRMDGTSIFQIIFVFLHSDQIRLPRPEPVSQQELSPPTAGSIPESAPRAASEAAPAPSVPQRRQPHSPV
jgi:hypothetical protein